MEYSQKKRVLNGLQKAHPKKKSGRNVEFNLENRIFMIFNESYPDLHLCYLEAEFKNGRLIWFDVKDSSKGLSKIRFSQEENYCLLRIDDPNFIPLELSIRRDLVEKDFLIKVSSSFDILYDLSPLRNPSRSVQKDGKEYLYFYSSDSLKISENKGIEKQTSSLQANHILLQILKPFQLETIDSMEKKNVFFHYTEENGIMIIPCSNINHRLLIRKGFENELISVDGSLSPDQIYQLLT